MYMSKRSRLGSSITMSPAQKLRDWSIHNMTSLLFAAILGVAWYVLVYFGCSLTLFLGSEVGDIWPKDGTVTAGMLYDTPGAEAAKIGGLVGLVIYILRKARR